MKRAEQKLEWSDIGPDMRGRDIWRPGDLRGISSHDGVHTRLGPPRFLTPSGGIVFGFGPRLGQDRGLEGGAGGVSRESPRDTRRRKFLQ